MGLSTRELDRLIKLKADGRTNAEIAQHYGVSLTTVKRYCALAKQAQKTPGIKAQSSKADVKRAVKSDLTQDFDYDSIIIEPEDEIIVKSENCIVSGDFHVPGENKAAIRQMLEYAKEHKISNLIINGDFWNNDAVSSWELKDPGMGLSKEIQQGCRLLRMLMQHFKVYLVCGNHDIRMPRALSHAINFAEWMASLFPEDVGERLFVTNFDHLYLESGNRVFRICHPSLYSKIKGRTVSLLSQDIHENVIMGHQHFLSISTNQTGRYVCIDGGCMCDPKMFLYKRAQTSRFPEWENGFVHVRGGKVRLLAGYSF